jgi:hypothetical protein
MTTLDSGKSNAIKLYTKVFTFIPLVGGVKGTEPAVLFASPALPAIVRGSLFNPNGKALYAGQTHDGSVSF